MSLIVRDIPPRPVGAKFESPEFGRWLELLRSRILEDSWTPVLTFATPGDLSVTYSQQSGLYVKMGTLILAQCDITTSAFTHTTASGDLRITGLPFAARTTGSPRNLGGGRWRGITFAGSLVGASDIAANVDTANSYINLVASGSAIAGGNVQAADMPTGGTVIIRTSVFYFVENP